MQRFKFYRGGFNSPMCPCCIQASDHGKYVLHSEAQARISQLEAALRATIAYMKDDSGGYEVYRATLDSAEAALEKQP